MKLSTSLRVLGAGSVLATALVISGCDSSNNGTKEKAAKEKVTQEKPALQKNASQDLSSKNEVAQLQDLTKIYQKATQALFKKRALSATLYGLSEDEVGQYYADQMEDYSPENEAALRTELLALTEKIAGFANQSKSSSAIENQLVMASLTRYFGGHPDFSIGYIDVWMGLSPFIVNQINGPLIDIPRYMQSDQKISNEKDAMDYIERLGKFDSLIGSIQNKLSADVKKNWIAPKVNLQGAVRYFDSFLQPKPEEHPLVNAFVEKLALLDGVPEEKKQKLIQLAKQKVADVVYPAYQKISEQTKSLMDKARDESGIWAQPNGDKYYQDAIRQLGDSDRSAEEIHQIGLDEVARVTKEMDAILKSQGYDKGSVGERVIAVTEEPRFLYADSDEGRKELLNDLNGYIAEITEKMADLFKTKPPYQVEVRAFPVEIQDGAPGGQYTPPSVDGSKPGIYWINLRDMKAVPKFSLKSLTYHEANPGHHWQVALNMAQTELPFLRRIAPYNAYVEGWALYSEQVAAEMGLYENDPFGDLGRLQAELFRAVRLVVDTGLHHKRWTREQAIAYMAEQTGSAESDVVAEIERYMAWPGQALGYKLGMLKILELRAHAKKALGEKFDLAEFHDLVLLGGAVPMVVLERKVKDWIAGKK
ncbi:DUF885 domain-containing protein [Aliikangiella coralliicola]|uniref:DUF885 domain-containing protein n=1 Tax=Aliikangiella coralliicola TaxID=2592383 RepID=A0A545U657_9GAMM|nr:DUF885 domain-containing protein [Aliikangiella coralliicola]TQV84965.1 DUF885 domain-containing protein [Aliikangiella coralliicola]